MIRTISKRPTAAGLSAILFAALLASSTVLPRPAFALSELKQIPGQEQDKDAPRDDSQDAEPEPQPSLRLPLPDPLINKRNQNKDDAVTDDKPEPPVEVLSDVSKIPKPVARMRELIVEAAASGDVERLRQLLGKGPTQTQVGESDGDPVDAIKGLSGDPDGIEILAIMLDLLSTGFVLMDKGTPEETYVWPYFVAKPLSTLTPPEKVDLFRLITAGDFVDMEEGGNYNFYRIGITPDGQWKFFTTGD